MTEKIVITSGRKYIDMDAYAGIFAYRCLLKSLGCNVYAYTTAILNESVSNVILDLGFEFDVDVSTDDISKFIVLDVSNPDFFDTIVNQDNIIEIIDHHTGYEDYWKRRNVNSEIEFIGSICTIIFEKFIINGKEDLLDKSLCKLLIAGILDNTLNLKSDITTDRDKEAYYRLLEIGNICSDWANVYFESCYNELENVLEESIINDVKIEDTSFLLPKVLGQLIVLDIRVIFNNMNRVMSVFGEYDEWLFNVISLEEGKSYLFYSSEQVKENLLCLFDGKEAKNYLVLDKCYLRKEIIKRAREYDEK